MVCSCNGKCRKCKASDMCSQLSDALKAIDGELDLIAGSLRVSSGIKSLRRFAMKFGEYMPIGELESCERDLEKRRTELLALREERCREFLEACPNDNCQTLCRTDIGSPEESGEDTGSYKRTQGRRDVLEPSKR
jgi:hypothetical protein